MFKADFSRIGLVIAIVLVAFSVGPFDLPSAGADEIPENCLTPCAYAEAGAQATIGGYMLTGTGYGGGPLGGTVEIVLISGAEIVPPIDPPGLPEPIPQSSEPGPTCVYLMLSNCAVSASQVGVARCVTAIVTTTDGLGPAQDTDDACAS